MATNDHGPTARTATASAPPVGSPVRVVTPALIVLLAWQLMVVIDGTIVTIALPQIRENLGFSEEGLSWVVNIYALAFGGLVLLGSRASDAFGRRRMLVVGVTVFSLASLIGFVAWTPGVLIAGRVLQGIGAAMAAPSSLSLITTNFAEGPARNKALGLAAGVAGLGGSVGLVMGGVLTSWLSWHWVFFVNVPIGMAVVLLAPRVVKDAPPQPGRLDVVGGATSTIGVTALVYGFIHASEHGWRDAETVGAFAAAVILLAAFAAIERRSDHPLIPARLLEHRDRVVALLLMLMVPTVTFGVFYFLTQYMQNLLAMSAIATGFAFLPFSAIVVAGSKYVPDVTQKLGARLVVMVGSAIMLGGVLMLSRLDDSSTYGLGILPGMVLTAAGVVLTFVPLNLLIMGTVAPEDSGIASGLVQTMQQVGSAIGIALMISVFAARERDALDRGAEAAVATVEGMQGGYLAAALVTALVLALATVALRRRVAVPAPASAA